MGRKEPTGHCIKDVPSLGKVKGHTYDGGVLQFFGIPYGRLTKRWTRATLVSSWEADFHDGTRLGPVSPAPGFWKAEEDIMVPVAETYMEKPPTSELDCLSINIAIPPSSAGAGPFPVLVYIHGGAFIIGGAYLPIFDGAHLATFAAERGSPTIIVSFSYRIGHGGFLASKDIEKDLRADGLKGNGNFGITDQRLALEWVQAYIGAFGGDAERVTVCGESAGSTSVGLHALAAPSGLFNRAICMSGQASMMDCWSPEDHEHRYQNLLKHFGIDATIPNALDKLRAVPEADVANALNVGEGASFPVSFPCYDGDSVLAPVPLDYAQQFPEWLEAVMIGHVADEGYLGGLTVPKYEYNHFRAELLRFMSDKDADMIFALYNINPDTDKPELFKLIYKMLGDALFGLPDWHTMQHARLKQKFAYHFNQISTLENAFQGLSYHAIDLLYLFMNKMDGMTPAQLELSHKFAGAFLDFTAGRQPWAPYGEEGNWMVFQNDDASVRSEVDHSDMLLYRIAGRLQAENLTTAFKNAAERILLESHLIEASRK